MTVECIRCEQVREEIEGTPYGGALGKILKTQVCNDCWNEWYAQSIKIINEYHISLRDQKGRDFLAKQMKIFFKMEPAPEGEALKLGDDPSN